MRTIESLDHAFKMVKKFQMLDILDKEYKKDTKNFYTSIILLVASIFGCIFISPLFLFLAICGTGISIYGLIKTKDICHQLDELEEKDFNLSDPTGIKEIDEIVEKTKDKYACNYYTDEYIKNAKSGFGEKIKNNFLNKENTILFLKDDIRIYYDTYKLPPFSISSDEWDLLTDTLYELFKEKNIEYDFYRFMSDLLKYTFAEQLINNGICISLLMLLNNLDNIKAINISKDELENIKNTILGLRVNTINKHIQKRSLPK